MFKDAKNKIAFQGEHGAFSEMALLEYFGSDAAPSPTQSFYEVFEKVKKGECEYGILPVENTLGGIVYQVWDCLNDFKLNIVGEINVKIEHCLIAHHDTKIENIKKVYAHYQASLQCENYIKAHNLVVKEAYDTAGSVKMVKSLKGSEKNISAAIASLRAAEIYGMQILKKGIQDYKKNYTRFVVISKEKQKEGVKFTFACSTKHKPGSLLDILKIVKKYKVNLTAIHSRPDKKTPFQYNFFIEGIIEKKMDDFLAEIKKNSTNFKLLGVYNLFN